LKYWWFIRGIFETFGLRDNGSFCLVFLKLLENPFKKIKIQTQMTQTHFLNKNTSFPSNIPFLLSWENIKLNFPPHKTHLQNNPSLSQKQMFQTIPFKKTLTITFSRQKILFLQTNKLDHVQIKTNQSNLHPSISPKMTWSWHFVAVASPNYVSEFELALD